MGAGIDDAGATPRVRRPDWRVASIVVVAFAALATFRKVASWDFWWHLAIGREAVRTASTVPADTFSYSFAGQPYVHKDLAADVLFFGVFDRVGHLGVALLQTAALLGALWAIRVAMGSRARPLVWVVLAGLYVVAVQSRIIPRPLVFTEGFFPLVLAVIEVARRRAAVGGRALAVSVAPVVAVMWVWLNLHRGGLIGLVVLLGFGLSLALQRLMHAAGPLERVAGPRPTWGAVGAAFAVFGAAVAAGLVNPSGVGLYTSGLSVTHDPIHRTFISEWQPLTWDLALHVHPVASGLIAAAWAVLVVRLAGALTGRIAGRSPVDVWHAGVLALFTYQGVASMRWLTHASAAAVLVLALVAVEALNAAERRRPIATPRPLLALIALVGALAIHGTNAHPLGLGNVPGRYPVGALQAADALALGPNVHNTFVYGGYTIWASDGRRRVLIDGRNDMVYPSEFFLRCVRAQQDLGLFAELWTETGGDWVLADNTPGRETFRFLAGHPDWMTLYLSEDAVVYVPRGRRPDLELHAFRHISPADPVGSLLAALHRAGGDPATVQAIGAEVSRIVTASPDGVRANTLAALYNHALGPSHFPARDAVLEHLDAVAPDHPAVIELRARLRGE